MEDQVTKAPAWAYYAAGAVIVLLPSAYALFKLIFWVKEEWRKAKKADDELEEAQRKAAEEAAARSAAMINASLNSQVQLLVAEVQDLRVKVNDCHTDRAGVKALLRLVALWAQKKGMPMTSELERIIKEDSSSPHKPVAPTEAKQ